MSDADNEAVFFDVDRTLKALDCDIGASECHGVLCGMLSSSRNFEVGGWLAHTLGYQDEAEVGLLASDSAILSLFKQTLSRIDADDFSFFLFLPEDEYPLTARVEALGAWCRGFLSGFGLSDVTNIKQLSGDIEDYLRVLNDIGKVNSQDLEAESGEQDLFELQEYVRMGALLVREEFKIAYANDDSNANPDPTASRSLH
jgi:uncharacterized protein